MAFTVPSDRDILDTAMTRGGAGSVLVKLPKGIETVLDRTWTPPGGEDVGKRDNQRGGGGGSPGLPSLPPPPPPPGGRGRGPPGSSFGSEPQRPMGLPPSPPPGPPPEMMDQPPLSPMMMGKRGKKAAFKREAVGLSGGQWQRIALARAFMRSDQADLVVFE